MILTRITNVIRKAAYRISNPLAIRYGVMLALVELGLMVHIGYRRPGMTTAWLSWLGTGLSILAFLLLINSFYGRRTAGDKFHQMVRWIDRGATLATGIFVAYSTVLFINGRFDESSPIEQRAEIISITPGGLFGTASVAKIRSADTSEGTHAIILTGQEPSLLWPSEPVLVQLRAGLLRLPWVTRIERDDEQYWRGVLAQLPDAAEAWKKLTWFYLNHHRPKDAAQAAQRYLELRPDDGEYACAIAGTLAVHGLHKEARALLEPFMTRNPDYWTYDVMGAIFHKLGDDVQSEQLFRAAIALDPENAQAYFELGYAYKDMGRYEDAIAMFTKALQYRPVFPEMDEQIQLLQGKVVARSPS